MSTEVAACHWGGTEVGVCCKWLWLHGPPSYLIPWAHDSAHNVALNFLCSPAHTWKRGNMVRDDTCLMIINWLDGNRCDNTNVAPILNKCLLDIILETTCLHSNINKTFKIYCSAVLMDVASLLKKILCMYGQTDIQKYLVMDVATGRHDKMYCKYILSWGADKNKVEQFCGEFILPQQWVFNDVQLAF